MRKTVVEVMAALTLAALLTAAGAAMASPHGEPRFLLLHLDGIPASLLQRELDAGRLPNLSHAFAGGGCLRALSLWPGGTEMIYPRLKGGTGPANGLPVAWTSWDREKSKPFGKVNIFFRLAGALPREARYQLLEGFGRGDLTAGLAMQNLPDLLKTRRVAEFFWFATDGAAHLAGEKALLASLRHFDWWFGKALARLDLSNLNLILYCDHGMVFSRNSISVPAALQRALGDQTLYYSYPNVYLRDPGQSGRAAEVLAREPEIDFAFFREGSGRVRGFCKQGTLEFVAEGDGLRYDWQGAGPDPFGYAQAGYRGEALSDEEWLKRTAALPFPAVPVQIGRFMANPFAGDVVVVVDPPRRDWTFACPEAGHQGLTADDLLVSVFFTGPDVEPLHGLDTLWLHTLYQRLPALDLSNQRPAREEDRLALFAGPGEAEAELSPAYRWRAWAAAPLTGFSGGALLLEHDVFRTYLGGIWLGAGLIQGRPGAALDWALDLKAGPVRAQYREVRLPPGQEARRNWTFGYDLTGGLTLEVRSGGRCGLALRW
ncbi:MAG: hypothetical protein ACM3RP_03495 [Chitinophagales bacterium]